MTNATRDIDTGLTPFQQLVSGKRLAAPGSSWRAELADALRAVQARPEALPHQRPPDDPDWHTWVLAAGRGAGKSFATMLWLSGECERIPGLRARIIAPTFADGVASCVEGPNGLLARSPRAVWRPSAAGGARVEYPNRSMVWVLGTPGPRDVDRLRALTNIGVDVFEEAAANPHLSAAVAQAALSRRQTGAGRTRLAVSSTPRPVEQMRKWRDDKSVHYVVVGSHANTHADTTWLAKLDAEYKGTRLYRQEVLGEILDDVIGALWSYGDLERSTVPRDLDRITRAVVGVDPPSGSGTCGIVVCGEDAQGEVYVLDDYSVTDALPERWAARVRQAHKDYDGALVVAEINQGGKMVRSVLEQAGRLPITDVRASVGKATRAEPVALRWEAEHQTAHLMPDKPGALDALTSQLTSWVPGDESPDRLDACVWACTYLMRGGVETAARASRHASRSL